MLPSCLCASVPLCLCASVPASVPFFLHAYRHAFFPSCLPPRLLFSCPPTCCVSRSTRSDLIVHMLHASCFILHTSNTSTFERGRVQKLIRSISCNECLFVLPHVHGLFSPHEAVSKYLKSSKLLKQVVSSVKLQELSKSSDYSMSYSWVELIKF